ncbi:hypothetical protein SAMN06309944_2436 [Micrococcales bacterium KH10]|nr:hypothetical protein SAMN06309944_2436 [Micrococcales bacterium KH10]
MTEQEQFSLDALSDELAGLDHKPVNEHVEFYEAAYGALVNQFTASSR